MWTASLIVIYLILTVFAFLIAYSLDLFGDKRSKFQRFRQIVGYVLAGWLILIAILIIFILYGVISILNCIFRLDMV